ncbi:MAG: hypothetical protein IJ325_06500 [Clostridia bacterium]|nr:hypothetical protein [Clostridia bacterium]
MKFYDTTLKQLYDMTAEKKRLDAKYADLKAQAATYEEQVAILRASCAKEQEDVDKLEGRSLAAYFYNIIGKKNEKLDKEREEAYAARVKLDAAERELSAVKSEMASVRSRLGELSGCENAYSHALESRREEIKASSTPEAEELLRLEGEITHTESQQKEIGEAILAGNAAFAIAEKILSELDSADGWNTWDMFGGGGLITHMAKHEHLDDAQELVETLQDKLRSFKTELADVSINADMQVNIDGFLRFADYFFDGLFADWAVADRISESMSAVQKTKNQIGHLVDNLTKMKEDAERWEKRLRDRADALVAES